MTILPTLHDLPKDQTFVLGIGFFDGCHLGHQVVFDEVKRLAKEKGALPGILTFYSIHTPVTEAEFPLHAANSPVNKVVANIFFFIILRYC